MAHGLWLMAYGLWRKSQLFDLRPFETLDLGPETLDFGPWTLDFPPRGRYSSREDLSQ